jgi:hypothetical protein
VNTPDRFDEKAAWALDALEPADREVFEAWLREHPEELPEADALREVASRLAPPVDPPAGLRASILAEVARTPQETQQAPDELQIRRERRRGRSRGPSRWSVLVAAAGVLLAVGGVGYGLTREPEPVGVEQAARQQVTDLMTTPGATVQTVRASDGGTATLVLSGDRLGVLTAGLPEVSSGEGYQLWLAQGDTVSSAGMLTVSAGTGASVLDVGSADGLGISVEPEAGSEQPTTTPVVFTPIVAA